MKTVSNYALRLIVSVLVLVAPVIAASPAQATSVTFNSLVSFASTTTGQNPQAALVLGSDGDYYGTTADGGPGGVGVFFKVTPSGTLTPLHPFTTTGFPGIIPNGGVILDNDGNFYGCTAMFGGSETDKGTVYQMTSSGTLNQLHAFTGSDGSEPLGGLAKDSTGNLYGTTSAGGAHGDGEVFKITTGGSFSILHSFDGGDGNDPVASLYMAADGNFYGTTKLGGANALGTVFQISPSGSFSSLYSFSGPDGSKPTGTLVQYPYDAELYGTTTTGGDAGQGTVFKLLIGGALTTLHSFSGGTDGADPEAGVIVGADFNFYGVTDGGGLLTVGGAYQMTPDGTVTSLHSFSAGTGGDGAGPDASLVQASDGTFYGTTSVGGVSGDGTIFSLVVSTGGALTPTTTTLVSSKNPANLGASITLTATVSPTVPIGETVRFFDGDTTIGIDSTALGFASLTINTLSAGSHNITATYLGDLTFATSTSPVLTQVINGAGITTTKTKIKSSLNPSPFGTAVTFTATVTPAVPDGETITFLDAGTSIGTGNTTGGIATFVTSSLSVGSHPITASYPGDASFSSSNSGTATQVVNAPPVVPHSFGAGIQMISVPTNYLVKTIANVLGYSSPILAVWEPSGDMYSVTPTPPANSLVAGQGYWVRIPAGGATITAAGTAPGTQFTIAIVPGWNMIGCPQATAVPVSSLTVIDSSDVSHTFADAASSGLVQDPLYTFQSGDTAYEVVTGASGTLQPYFGYWLYASASCTLSFP